MAKVPKPDFNCLASDFVRFTERTSTEIIFEIILLFFQNYVVETKWGQGAVQTMAFQSTVVIIVINNIYIYNELAEEETAFLVLI